MSPRLAGAQTGKPWRASAHRIGALWRRFFLRVWRARGAGPRRREGHEEGTKEDGEGNKEARKAGRGSGCWRGLGRRARCCVCRRSHGLAFGTGRGALAASPFSWLPGFLIRSFAVLRALFVFLVSSWLNRHAWRGRRTESSKPLPTATVQLVSSSMVWRCLTNSRSCSGCEVTLSVAMTAWGASLGQSASR